EIGQDTAYEESRTEAPDEFSNERRPQRRAHLSGFSIDSKTHDRNRNAEDHAPDVQSQSGQSTRGPRRPGKQRIGGDTSESNHAGSHQSLAGHGRELSGGFKRLPDVFQILASGLNIHGFRHQGAPPKCRPAVSRNLRQMSSTL